MVNFTEELKEKGYCVIDNILSQDEIDTSLIYFREWVESSEQFKKLHSKVSPHGIIKHFEVGHQKHAWYIRTREKVQNVFREIWNTNNLVVSFDGTCWMPINQEKHRDTIWTHSDQAPNKKGVCCCYQGFVSLTENKERTFVVYEGSHKLYENYCEIYNLSHTKNWQKIEPEYLSKIQDKKRILHVKAGSIVIWDSRTFHQNQYGNNSIKEERIVQYVSYLPKKGRSEKMKEKRLKYFNSKRTTSHWAYPVSVNGLQPQSYGNDELKIDYDSLISPELSEFEDKIYNLI